MKGFICSKLILMFLFAALFMNVQGQDKHHSDGNLKTDAAPTPPMGWNSYDAFGSTINESQFKAEVDFMKKNLLRFGWKYAVIDYLWYNPYTADWKETRARVEPSDIKLDKNGKPVELMTMDKYGRLLPSPNRFPSAAGEKGFKAIADYVHSKGLKFGIHIMRGIPRQAYWDNTPVKGTSYTARDIADTLSSGLCKWNNIMYSVNPDKPGAQEYYNSIVDMYAQWGVDFIKVDDISRPYHKGEVELLHKAILQCGRSIVLSLSPGEAPLAEAPSLIDNANMWRVSDDMWDNWKSVVHNMGLLNKWSPYIQKNHWPDGDMLPIGHLSLNNRPNGFERMSNLTKDETYTVLTLWSIARSPLIMGGELITSPKWVISLLQNKEVIYVDQHSTGNHQVFRNEDKLIWMAKDSVTGSIYLALFNLQDKPQLLDFKFDTVPGLKGQYKLRDLWSHKNNGIVKELVSAKIEPHGACLYKLTAVD